MPLSFVSTQHKSFSENWCSWEIGHGALLLFVPSLVSEHELINQRDRQPVNWSQRDTCYTLFCQPTTHLQPFCWKCLQRIIFNASLDKVEGHRIIEKEFKMSSDNEGDNYAGYLVIISLIGAGWVFIHHLTVTPTQKADSHSTFSLKISWYCIKL